MIKASWLPDYIGFDILPFEYFTLGLRTLLKEDKSDLLFCVKQVEESMAVLFRNWVDSRGWQHGQKDGKVGEDATVANPREIALPLKMKLAAKILCDQEGRASGGI